ncbi:hypothetical protein LCGC14_0989830 [marine sediment metagenome]|uniref:Uncharacterized protein n=1 Tax=marine sediment metagenome TaxID=412755 RepID=A0A0F9N5Z9_9ZZZZ
MTTLTETQLPLTGLELKEQGIASVSRHSWVNRARGVAEYICRERGVVSSDDVHIVMGDEPPNPNCYGAIFAGQRFAWTGQYIKSTRPEAHYRDIKVWRLA